MRNTVLILTNSEDGQHSDIVISKILNVGGKVFRFDSDRFSSGEVIINFHGANGEMGFAIEDGVNSITDKDIKSVWYRRPNRFNFPIQDIIQRNHAEAETKSFLEGLWVVLERKVFWVSEPSHLERARKKILQLDIARRKNMPFPRTLVSNDPGKVLEFYESCNRRMIFKAIYHEFLDYGATSYNIPTTLVTPEHIRKIELVKHSPSLFQEFIEKKSELRITVVGDKIFPVRIDSQSNPSTVVDWRNPEFVSKLGYSKTNIDGRTKKFCREMLQELNLEFGAFDFILGKDGGTYFLEVNPNGQWYWLEESAGVLISDALANTLVNAERR